ECLLMEKASDPSSRKPGCTGGHTRPVGRKLANPWGLHDMHGNVWEWCSDWFGNYLRGEQADTVGSNSVRDRIFRGGAMNTLAGFCRSARRFFNLPSSTFYNLGFRPVLVSVEYPKSP
ncbi:MAG TPA: formylglycine-generating enzyme family protein, partial [Verrucomicrobiales bacterium]|nr:formylglycine-generating enzyme family protein [Verrucomicrobiales bacterium]